MSNPDIYCGDTLSIIQHFSRFVSPSQDVDNGNSPCRPSENYDDLYPAGSDPHEQLASRE